MIDIDLVAHVKNPLLVRQSVNGLSSVIWDQSRSLIDDRYPSQPDVHEGLYWVHKILRNGTEFLIETLDGQLVEVHQDNAVLA
jgi:hypothetical protein